MAHIVDNAKQTRAVAREQAGSGVRAVANLSGGLKHPVPRLGTRTGHRPYDKRHQRPRHARARGDILQCRALVGSHDGGLRHGVSFLGGPHVLRISSVGILGDGQTPVLTFILGPVILGCLERSKRAL